MEIEELTSLPVEDTVWFVNNFIAEEEEFLYMLDRKSREIGRQDHKQKENSDLDIYHFIMQCCQSPNIPPPRKPRFILLKCGNFESDDRKLRECLQNVGISLAGTCITSVSDGTRWRECYHCHMRAEQKLFLLCSSCRGVLYCSQECKTKDAEGDSYNSHNFWCQKFKEYMLQEQAITHFPFEFSSETCAVDFDVIKYREFLKHHGVYGEGCWKREGLQRENAFSSCPFGQYINFSDPYVLPVESCLLEEALSVDVIDDIMDWKSYYESHQFNFGSPIAILLQWPLTIFYIIKQFLKDGHDFLIMKDMITIDIVGVEKEVELIPIFQELGNLFYDKVLDIHMFGRKLHNSVKKLSHKDKNIYITVHNKLYHKHSCDRTTDLVIGFNAGLSAYPTWMETINVLKNKRTPSYFTDYGRSSIEMSKLMVESCCGITLSEPVLNPFRSPVRHYSDDHNLPWFSNCFIYNLKYT